MGRLSVTALFAAFVVTVISTMPAAGQSQSVTRIQERARQLGFSHVDALEVGGIHRVGFQNRRHRDEGQAVRELLESVGADVERFSLTGRARGVDVYRLAIDDDEVTVLPAPAGAAASQPFLADLVIHPFFAALLGSYDQPVRTRTGIAPEVAVYPWIGGRISAQVELAAVDDVSLNPKRVAPGLVTASQWLRVPVGYTYAAAGAGHFSHERYGIYADIQSLFLRGRISLHGSAAYTGFAALENRTWYVGSMNRVQALAGVEYVHPGLAASVLVRGGVFLEEDRGIRVDVRRAFGAFQVGFFGVSTTIDNTAGVSVRIPLVPSRHSGGWARVVPARQLPIEYRYSADGGRMLRTGFEVDLFANQLHPLVVEMQLNRARRGR